MVANCTSNYHTESLKVSLIIFYLNMVDYPVFFPMLSTLTCDTQWPISDSSEAKFPFTFFIFGLGLDWILALVISISKRTLLLLNFRLS